MSEGFQRFRRESRHVALRAGVALAFDPKRGA